MQTYFGCLACDRKRTCPPDRGWPQGKRVPVRELMGLTSPWYFSAVPRGSKRVAAYAEAFSQLEDPTGFGAKCARHAAPRLLPLPALHAAHTPWHTQHAPHTSSQLSRTHP